MIWNRLGVTGKIINWNSCMNLICTVSLCGSSILLILKQMSLENKHIFYYFRFHRTKIIITLFTSQFSTFLFIGPGASLSTYCKIKYFANISHGMISRNYWISVYLIFNYSSSVSISRFIDNRFLIKLVHTYLHNYEFSIWTK